MAGRRPDGGRHRSHCDVRWTILATSPKTSFTVWLRAASAAGRVLSGRQAYAGSGIRVLVTSAPNERSAVSSPA